MKVMCGEGNMMQIFVVTGKMKSVEEAECTLISYKKVAREEVDEKSICYKLQSF